MAGWQALRSIRHQEIQVGPCLFQQKAPPVREGKEGREGWDRVLGTGSRGAGVCGLWHSFSPCCPISAASIPLPHQEHLSSTLAALRSNQIITLKVCRFWTAS